MTNKAESCQDRLPTHLESRIKDFQRFYEVVNNDAGTDEDYGTDSESAYERIAEYPLGVSTYTVYRVELSTGGPADRLDVWVDEGEIQRIQYSFMDWFDGATVDLVGPEFEAAEWFMQALIPEVQ